MVLNSEVLPAPWGPITAVIEPGCTAKPTPDSAFTPPKASVTSLTCSRGEPSLGWPMVVSITFLEGRFAMACQKRYRSGFLLLRKLSYLRVDSWCVRCFWALGLTRNLQN